MLLEPNELVAEKKGAIVEKIKIDSSMKPAHDKAIFHLSKYSQVI